MNKLYIKIRNTKLARLLVKATRRIILPGFDGMPLYDVLLFFVKGLWNGAITTRASSVAFKFFVALFPAIIFLFTVIPYIPVENFQTALMSTIKGVLPINFYLMVESTIQDIVLRQHGGLLSIGFLLALYFSANGILGMITAFNNTTHSIETRTVFKQYLISILLVFIVVVILLVSVSAIIGGTEIMNYLRDQQILTSGLAYYLIKISRWIVVLLMLFFAVSFMYFLAPARKTHFRFISAGSTLATLLFLATTAGFNYYVDQFSNYNALYGSIGTLLIIMMWFYFNSLVLIIGFELNASIAGARIHKENIDGNLKGPVSF
jgi:membrane protein